MEVNMKKLLLVPLLLSSQLLVADDVDLGGFGGPVIKVTHVADNDTALMIGAKGAFLVDHSFYVGGAGYFLASNESYEIDNGSNLDTYFGYGGVLLGYIFAPENSIKFNTSLLLGASGNVLYDLPEDGGITVSEYSYAFTSELECSLIFDVSEYFKIEAGVGYRYVDDTKYYSSDELSGYSVNVGFLFGEF
jgi:hypothetical protein